ncbi:uncharacterized protein LOC106465805 [Limulus polyphemus]|uniref:Uncharacterized protein LOC106465805 n=1 Tax=Limulus polyphemus TaxID=6850 RepID=A0ABM1T1M6_LIMPO|nr:uncharacterized protein LOC106465805 [Limulus polyphemus]
MLEVLSNVFGRKKPQQSEPLPLTIIEDKPETVDGFVILGRTSVDERAVTENKCSSVDQSLPVQPSTSRCETHLSKGVCGVDGVPFTVHASLNSQDQITDVLSDVFQCTENLEKYDSTKQLTDKRYSFSMERSVLNETTTEK